MQREQLAVVQDENKLGRVVDEQLHSLESDLLAVLAQHDPSQYTQTAARERHLATLIATGGAIILASYRKLEKQTFNQLVLTAKTTAEHIEQALAVYLKIRSLRVSDGY